MRTLRVSGHGWVIPRPDGGHSRCGGPAICPDCKAEADSLAERNLEVVWAVRLAPGMITEDGRTIKWVNGREVAFTNGKIERDVTWLPIRRDGAHPLRAAEGLSSTAQAALSGVRDAFGHYQTAARSARTHWQSTVTLMVEARDAGVSMARIGAEVGLTRERVRQIINEWRPRDAVNGGTHQ